MEVKITAYGHACFMLEAEGYRTVLDPYRHGMVPGLPDLNLEAEAVYCSHGHDDHGFVDAVTLKAGGKAPYTLTEFITPHDDVNGAKRGMNTVRIFDFDGLRVAHLGDLGCFPDAALEDALRGVDCLLIPVGGFFTINSQTAAQIIRSINPKVAIPMHYRTEDTGFDAISHLDDFVKLFGCVNSRDNTFVLTPNTEKQILVLNYKP